ncbi:two-component system response regulator [Oceanicoccus sp. KOV_DT_Chl]|uniref:response regulator n=1 Tax=Oceanicoccus sp. KOV_DT_Chl TaxID=1904639 RepID=UPI000C7DA350|nr:response regulator [Oceanicoccus sp. KOV_DT_Chl]
MKKNLVIVDGYSVGPALYQRFAEVYNPILCSTGHELRLLLGRVNADMFLIETNLPCMQSDEVCRMIRQAPEYHSSPIIFFGNKISLKAEYLGYEAGGDAYINKYDDIDQLLLRLEGYLHQKTCQTKRQLENGKLSQNARLNISQQWSWEVLTANLKNIVASRDTDQLANSVINSCEELSLSNSAMFYLPTGSKYFSRLGGNHAAKEYQLLLEAKQGGDIIAMGNQLVFNARNCNLLVRDKQHAQLNTQQLLPIMKIMLKSASDTLGLLASR